ncbi:helix-turn-helix transcriptional regulator [Novosphingobium sp. PhB165]|uniref:helix-turn-helix transcriptional regulator n=1 Tax=Novosphingobium sp. PhB165 TaxID=2485105 RepID=UPI00326141A6
MTLLLPHVSYTLHEQRPDMNNRLRELRSEHGLSQAGLGGSVGVSRQAINLIENGKHDPSLSLAYAIARVFGLPVEAIFWEGDDEPCR